MQLEPLPLTVAAALFGYCFTALVNEARRSRRHALVVRKLYASPVFDDMLPLLRIARKRHIEQLTIDKTGVLFTFMYPSGSHNAFMMKNYGYPYLNMEQQEAMRTLLEECLPKLRDASRYHHSQKRVRLINGEVEYVFRYAMQNQYKAMLNRAPYYDASLQAKLR